MQHTDNMTWFFSVESGLVYTFSVKFDGKYQLSEACLVYAFITACSLIKNTGKQNLM